MDFFTKTERTILGSLSANSRTSVTELAKEAKCSRVTAVKNLNRLEKRFNIRYTLEIDESKLVGCERHLLAIKFVKKPSVAFLKEFFKNDEFAEEVFLLDGHYDLFIFGWAGDPVSYIKWETYLASELAEFKPEIRSTELVVSLFGFWPLNDSFVDEIHESIKLDKVDRKMLALLNEDSRMSLSDMAKMMEIGRGTVRYRLFRLMKSGIIKRFTLAIQSPPQKYQLLYFVNYTFNKGVRDRFLELRRRYQSMDDQEHPILGTIQFAAQLSGSFRSFGMAISNTEEEAMDSVIDMSKEVLMMDNPVITHARIVKVIKGLLPLRNLDIKRNYMKIDWMPND
ncbi:MAG: winged helix-turn-helix transcriptional regulator [Candidatus Marsarchaeota archaeon]|nr:winged helix-turn-helix transcriptional regulator [Candidatus Marsarchaeota archaeon]